MFKKDFIWGTATASYQIEGGAYEDGKGLSIWDTFCTQPNRVHEGQNGTVACDHYHLYQNDFKLMAQLGLKHYRFSFSWPRIIPNGIGEINQNGINFYSNMIDEMLANGITPYATLFHWDYPHALFQKGGWLNPDSSKWFSEYASVIAQHFGDRVKHFFTINEPQCFIGLGHLQTIHAPGIAFPLKDNLKMAHNVLLSHGLSVQVLRAQVSTCSVGCAHTGAFFHPHQDTVQNRKAAQIATFDAKPENWSFNVAWWSDPILFGHYPKSCAENFGENMIEIGQDDMKNIFQPLDFYGVNVYQSKPVVFDGDEGYLLVDHAIGHSKTAFDWPVTPESLYYTPKFLYERYKIKIYITENGLSTHDAVSLDGKVHDPNRIDFLNRYLLALQQATADGVDIEAYFHWSFMDNFEWAKGYDERFGLIYIDFQTQQRIPKDSSFWYQQVIQNNGKNL